MTENSRIQRSLVLAVLTLAGVACQAPAPESSGQSPKTADELSSLLNESDASDEDWRQIEELIVVCMKDQGFEYLPEPPPTAWVETDSPFIDTTFNSYTAEATVNAQHHIDESFGDLAAWQLALDGAPEGQLTVGQTVTEDQMVPELLGCRNYAGLSYQGREKQNAITRTYAVMATVDDAVRSQDAVIEAEISLQNCQKRLGQDEMDSFVSEVDSLTKEEFLTRVAELRLREAEIVQHQADACGAEQDTYDKEYKKAWDASTPDALDGIGQDLQYLQGN